MASSQLSALADPTRRSIFETLVRAPSSVGSLAARLPVSRPAVSQHLKVLSEAGLVTSTTVGTRRVYSIRHQGLHELGSWLEEIWDAALDSFERAAKEEHRMTTTQHRVIPPVVKTRTLPLSVERAFALFTEGMETWWPLGSHSITADEGGDVVGVTLRFEGKVGGRVVEVAADGTECAWADVMAWQPPHRLVLSWHPNREPKAATVLEVRFTPHPEGSEIHLEHRGWEELGERGSSVREGYDSGWDVVLGRFETT
jgi:DNA-binding transcriptional ArsR family regulator/uncharacterized protein YndB with AHSA1/START domain